jgi:hypothetical protein
MLQMLLEKNERQREQVSQLWTPGQTGKYKHILFYVLVVVLLGFGPLRAPTGRCAPPSLPVRSRSIAALFSAGANAFILLFLKLYYSVT